MDHWEKLPAPLIGSGTFSTRYLMIAAVRADIEFIDWDNYWDKLMILVPLG